MYGHRTENVWARQGCKVLTPCFRNGGAKPREDAKRPHASGQRGLSNPGVQVTAFTSQTRRMGREESAQTTRPDCSLLSSGLVRLLFQDGRKREARGPRTAPPPKRGSILGTSALYYGKRRVLGESLPGCLPRPKQRPLTGRKQCCEAGKRDRAKRREASGWSAMGFRDRQL